MKDKLAYYTEIRMMEVLDRKPEESSSEYHARLKAMSVAGWSDHDINVRAEQLWAVRAEIRREELAAKDSGVEIPS
jgi:hypothetical protein